MGIRFYCPNGHKLNVKTFQAGRRGICPYCGAKFLIPTESTRKSSKQERAAFRAVAARSQVSDGVSQMVAGNAPLSSAFAGASSTLVKKPNEINDAFSPEELSQELLQDGGNEASSLGSISESVTKGDSKAETKVPTTPARPADPITEAGDVVWYVRPPSGGQYGPAMATIMRQWLAEGRISPDSLVWHEGWRDWQPAFAIFQQLNARESLEDTLADDTPFLQPMSSLVRSTSNRRSSHGIRMAVIILSILLIIVVVSMLLWMFYQDANPSGEISRAPSTLQGLGDTLNLPYLC